MRIWGQGGQPEMPAVFQDGSQTCWWVILNSHSQGILGKMREVKKKLQQYIHTEKAARGCCIDTIRQEKSYTRECVCVYVRVCDGGWALSCLLRYLVCVRPKAPAMTELTCNTWNRKYRSTSSFPSNHLTKSFNTQLKVKDLQQKTQSDFCQFSGLNS